MDPKVLIELFGYLGSTLVVVSMLMSNVVKLRLINTAGSVISATYALIIGSFPLALMNICLIIINLYNLHKLLKTKQEFEIVTGRGNEGMIKNILDHHYPDIMRFFPGFDGSTDDNDVVYVVCCNGVPAGILVGNDMQNGYIDVEIDYSTPAFRNCAVGKYLYEHLPEYGIHALMFTQNKTDEHEAYLTKMGFEQENGEYIKRLK